IDPQLVNGGRTVPVLLNMEASPPVLKLHGTLLQHVSDQEILTALARPLATLLHLSSVTVGLVVKERDEKQLTALANQAARQLTTPVAHLTEIEAIVEQRVKLFEERLYQLVYHLADRPLAELNGTEDFIGELIERSSKWPEWLDVEPYDYILEAIRNTVEVLGDVKGLPAIAVLVELIWESIGLSTQSFLRIAARTLRGGQGEIRRDYILHNLARVTSESGEPVCEALTSWPAFGELADAWVELWKCEQQLVGNRNANLDVPRVSVYAPPGDVMGLSEPESLPWQFPLLCWTIRERDALRDLLVGLTQALDKTQDSVAPPSVYLDLLDAYDSPLKMSDDHFNIGLQSLGVDVELPADYDALLLRALRSSYTTTLVQYGSLDEASRQRAFHLLLGAYTGYMPQAKAVWDRRFYKIKEMDRAEAFAALITKIQHVLRLPILFNVFEDPDVDMSMLMPMPAFDMVVALPEGLDQIPIHIPLGALKPSLGNAPIRIRVIRVPGDPKAACTWLCDHHLTLTELRTQSPDQMLRAVNNDILRMLVFH
ncbi:MAG: hypothetical protein ACNA8W_20375, partial [Bradymonadaceae bacterium]